MGDPMWMAVPPGGYSLDESEERWQRAYERGEHRSMADIVTDAAIEEARLRRAEKRRAK